MARKTLPAFPFPFQKAHDGTTFLPAAAASFRIHDARYQNGAESYLSALVSQCAMYAARQDLIGARLAKAANQVTLYKVLGGGWQTAEK